MRADDYFRGDWVEEVPRLRRLLARHGVPHDEVDDVVQETAVRMYAAWDRLFDGRPLRPLVTTIALNVARDYHRRSSHWARPVASVPEQALVDSRGVDSAVIARLEVARTARAMSKLSEGHRRAVVDAVTDDLVAEQTGRVRAPAATRMARTRARRHLVAALELTAGFAAIAGTWARRTFSSPAMTGSAAVGALALTAAVFLHAGSPGTASDRTAAPVGITHLTATGVPTAPGVQVVGHFVTAGGAWSLTGSSQWLPQAAVPLLRAQAFGHDANLGDYGSGHACSFAVADRVFVVVRCGAAA